MTTSIPLIRAAAIHPMRRWANQTQLDVEHLLAKAALEWVPEDQPYLPIPLRGAVQFLVEISREAGADAPHRIVNGRGGFEIGVIGAAAFVGPTVREGLRRISRKMPAHSTHEIFTVIDEPKSLRITDGWALDIGDLETLHYVQQYVASLIDMMCSVATGASPSVARVALVSHPETGVSHLKPWLGDRVQPAENRALDVLIDERVAGKAFPEHVITKATKSDALKQATLLSGHTLSDQAAVLVGSMLGKAQPTLGRLAAAASTSARSFRRQLSEEDTNLAQIVEKVRADRTLERLREDPSISLKELSHELGYANQETLSRAVKRWTGETPSRFRRQHS